MKFKLDQLLIFLCIYYTSFCLINRIFAEPKIEIEGRFWFPELSGNIKATDDSIEGTNIDLKDDLGIEDENFSDIRLTCNLGSADKIRLSYSQVEFSGEKDIVQTVIFEGQSYTSSTHVITNVDLDYLRLGWIHHFIRNNALKLGSTIEAKMFFIDASLAAPAIAISESEKFIGGLPTLGIVFEVEPHRIIKVFAEISGLPAGSYGYLLDGELGIRLNPIENFSITGGYRIFSMKVEDDSNHAELEIGGPFLGGLFRF
jgi:hypothetical protein